MVVYSLPALLCTPHSGSLSMLAVKYNSKLNIAFMFEGESVERNNNCVLSSNQRSMRTIAPFSFNEVMAYLLYFISISVTVFQYYLLAVLKLTQATKYCNVERYRIICYLTLGDRLMGSGVYLQFIFFFYYTRLEVVAACRQALILQDISAKSFMYGVLYISFLRI